MNTLRRRHFWSGTCHWICRLIRSDRFGLSFWKPNFEARFENLLTLSEWLHGFHVFFNPVAVLAQNPFRYYPYISFCLPLSLPVSLSISFALHSFLVDLIKRRNRIISNCSCSPFHGRSSVPWKVAKIAKTSFVDFSDSIFQNVFNSPLNDTVICQRMKLKIVFRYSRPSFFLRPFPERINHENNFFIICLFADQE